MKCGAISSSEEFSPYYLFIVIHLCDSFAALLQVRMAVKQQSTTSCGVMIVAIAASCCAHKICLIMIVCCIVSCSC